MMFIALSTTQNRMSTTTMKNSRRRRTHVKIGEIKVAPKRQADHKPYDVLTRF